MIDSLYQLVLDHLRAGKPEIDLMACGCMGCMNRVNGICACEQAGYSPNGVRRPCKCSCQLPEVAERNRRKREEMAGYVARAKAEIAAMALAGTCPECLSPFAGSHFGDCRIATGIKPARDSFDRADDRPIGQPAWSTWDPSTPLTVVERNPPPVMDLGHLTMVGAQEIVADGPGRYLVTVDPDCGDFTSGTGYENQTDTVFEVAQPIKPAIGMWWAECCIHDLEQITAESDLEGIQESLDETGASLWPDLESALQALERGGWDDEERAIADRLRSEVKR